MTSAVTYHRVSTADQDPELAREDLRRGAQARGLDVVEEIEETGSGARGDRPGLARVLDLARRSRISTVLVWKLDRFGRSSLDLLSNIKALTDAGVRFVAVTQGLDVQPRGDAMSQLILTVLAGVAEFERELIKERTAQGVAKARRKGVRLGRPRALTRDQVDRVRQLRFENVPWPGVAKIVGCSVSSARRAAPAQKGTPEQLSLTA